MDAFQLFVEIESLSTRADKSIKVVLSTQELPPESMSALFGLRHRAVYAAFLDTPITVEDIKIPDREPEFASQKSPSERLRNVLYRIWEQDGKVGDFETWRIGQMEIIIDQQKSKLKREF